VTDRTVVPVALEGCPVPLLERARRHNEALIREFAFIMESDEDRAGVPAQLLAVVDRIRSQIGVLTTDIESQIDRAREQGDASIDLLVVLPFEGRELALELKRLFDDADDFCRSGDLLTLAEPDDVRAFRDWYLDQYVEQLDGAAPTPWPRWRAANS
jgi:hypothetical protein